MNITFQKLELVSYTVSSEVFVKEHLYEVLNMADGYYLYTYDEQSFLLCKACVIPKELVKFNPCFKQNWHKLIPILESL